jgi:hypothetical protein
LAATAALVTSACSATSPLESTTSTIVVHGVLNTLYDDQIVAVQRTMGGTPIASPVDSAIVTITGPDGVVMTGVEVTDSTLTRVYRVRLSSFHEQLTAGYTYQLHVHLKTGEDVFGTTTIPDGQPLQSVPPSRSFSSQRDTLRLNWAAVHGASSYEVRVESTASVYALFTDTSAVLAGTLRSLDGTAVFTPGMSNLVLVSAVDANYYAYYRTNSDPFTGTAVQGNLVGAEGVFGSLVVVSAVELNVTAGN